MDSLVATVLPVCQSAPRKKRELASYFNCNTA
jgi:hypothetical protein